MCHDEVTRLIQPVLIIYRDTHAVVLADRLYRRDVAGAVSVPDISFVPLFTVLDREWVEWQSHRDAVAIATVHALAILVVPSLLVCRLHPCFAAQRACHPHHVISQLSACRRVDETTGLIHLAIRIHQPAQHTAAHFRRVVLVDIRDKSLRRTEIEQSIAAKPCAHAMYVYDITIAPIARKPERFQILLYLRVWLRIARRANAAVANPYA